MNSRADKQTDDRRDLTRNIKILLWASSKLVGSERCFGLYQEMRHPDGKSVTFSFPSKQDATFALQIRHPEVDSPGDGEMDCRPGALSGKLTSSFPRRCFRDVHSLVSPPDRRSRALAAGCLRAGRASPGRHRSHLC